MRRSFFVSSVVAIVAAAPAGAAMIPLLEMRFQDTDFRLGPLPVTVQFEFGAGDDFGFPYLVWKAEHDPSDVGQSFWGPAEVVGGANAALSNQRAQYYLLNGPPGDFASGIVLFVDGRHNVYGPCGELTFCNVFFVDDLGKHTVTAVERVIDFLVLTEIQPDVPPAQVGSYTIEASQTIRYWGVPVPEPAAALIFFIGGAHMYLSYRLRQRSRIAFRNSRCSQYTHRCRTGR